MICNRLHHTGFQPERVIRSFTVGGRFVIVENIPTDVCGRCGDVNYSAEVAERVRRLVHDPDRPPRKAEADLQRFDAA